MGADYSRALRLAGCFLGFVPAASIPSLSERSSSPESAGGRRAALNPFPFFMISTEISMSEPNYDAHPSLLRTHPFSTLITLLLIAGGLLVAVLGVQFIPPQFTGQFDSKMVQIAGIAVFAIATLKLLVSWVTTRSDRLVITDEELIWTHGLLSKQYTEIGMGSVRSVRVSQSLFQRIVNAGDVEIFTAGDDPELVVRGLPNPGRIRDLVNG